MWGEPGAEKSILLNDRSFMVRTNLWNFLDVARRKHNDIELWIDALCINQEDDQEKGHQVAMMGRIYSQAVSVLIWLEPGQSNSEDLQRVFTASRFLPTPVTCFRSRDIPEKMFVGPFITRANQLPIHPRVLEASLDCSRSLVSSPQSPYKR
jgi:hypothetical protein